MLHRDIAGSIGALTLPGLTKVVEEMGELAQVLAKISAIQEIGRYWDGSNLGAMLIDEIGDVEATLEYLKQKNKLDRKAIKKRKKFKLEKFARWHSNVRAGRPPNEDKATSDKTRRSAAVDRKGRKDDKSILRRGRKDA